MGAISKAGGIKEREFVAAGGAAWSTW